jgi:hypothetical protein
MTSLHQWSVGSITSLFTKLEQIPAMTHTFPSFSVDQNIGSMLSITKPAFLYVVLSTSLQL